MSRLQSARLAKFSVTFVFSALIASNAAAQLIAKVSPEKPAPARQINELCLVDGKLYIGQGDYGENTGPTDLLYYDLKVKNIVKEFTVDDEAIVRVRVLDGVPVIPGIDATEDWKFGNIYVQENDQWTKHRNLPRAVHVTDVCAHEKRWYASAAIVAPLGGKDEEDGFGCGAIFSSSNRGADWSLEYTTSSSGRSVTRIGSVIAFDGKVYAFPFSYTQMPATKVPPELLPLMQNPIGEEKGPHSYLVVVPDPTGPADAVVLDGDWKPCDLIPETGVCRIEPALCAGKLVMVVARGAFVPSAMHFKSVDRSKFGVATEVWVYDGKKSSQLPIKSDAITDILTKPDGLHLLSLFAGQWMICSTADLTNWIDRPLPDLPTEPLSIEKSDDAFFVGCKDGSLIRLPIEVP